MSSNPMPLPCPHCGAQVLTDHIPAHQHVIATFIPDATDTFTIECACGAGMCGHETMNDLVERWNKRASTPPAGVLISHSDANYVIGVLRGSMTFGPDRDKVWRRIESARATSTTEGGR